MAHATRKPGEFCWINMLTPDPDAARSFFGELLGWTYGAIPGMGWFIQVGGRPVGGLFDLDGPSTPPGTPPGIGLMVKVDDADAIAARARELGGGAKPAFDIGPQGRMAELTGPDGAALDVWQPKGMPGTDVDPDLPGAPTWFECLTRDPEGSRSFYADLFGWTPEPAPTPGTDYTVFKLDDAEVAGMLTIKPEMGDVPPFWTAYFLVEDPDAAAVKAVQLGGEICLPPTEVPGVGRLCALKSPQGVFFHAIRYAN